MTGAELRANLGVVQHEDQDMEAARCGGGPARSTTGS